VRVCVCARVSVHVCVCLWVRVYVCVSRFCFTEIVRVGDCEGMSLIGVKICMVGESAGVAILVGMLAALCFNWHYVCCCSHTSVPIVQTRSADFNRKRCTYIVIMCRVGQNYTSIQVNIRPYNTFQVFTADFRCFYDLQAYTVCLYIRIICRAYARIHKSHTRSRPTLTMCAWIQNSLTLHDCVWVLPGEELPGDVAAQTKHAKITAGEVRLFFGRDRVFKQPSMNKNIVTTKTPQVPFRGCVLENGGGKTLSVQTQMQQRLVYRHKHLVVYRHKHLVYRHKHLVVYRHKRLVVYRHKRLVYRHKHLVVYRHKRLVYRHKRLVYRHRRLVVYRHKRLVVYRHRRLVYRHKRLVVYRHKRLVVYRHNAWCTDTTLGVQTQTNAWCTDTNTWCTDTNAWWCTDTNAWCTDTNAWWCTDTTLGVQTQMQQLLVRA